MYFDELRCTERTFESYTPSECISRESGYIVKLTVLSTLDSFTPIRRSPKCTRTSHVVEKWNRTKRDLIVNGGKVNKYSDG